jgi:acetolactate synthase-1/2/3 large subunit
MDNRYLGMVRQWQDMFWDKRYSAVHLENPDFVKMAEAYEGVLALRIKRPADTARVIEKALAHNSGPVVIHCETEREDNVFPMIPPGASLKEIITEPPKEKLEKPTGST